MIPFAGSIGAAPAIPTPALDGVGSESPWNTAVAPEEPVRPPCAAGYDPRSGVGPMTACSSTGLAGVTTWNAGTPAFGLGAARCPVACSSRARAPTAIRAAGDAFVGNSVSRAAPDAIASACTAIAAEAAAAVPSTAGS